MKKTGKLIALLAAVMLILCFALTGCGNKPADDSKSDSETESTSNSASTGDSTSTGDSASTSTIADINISDLNYTDGTTLRMGTGYNNAKTGLTFKDDTIKGFDTTTGKITLSDGKTYGKGDLKPTWVEVENRLNVKFTDVYNGKSASAEFDVWKEKYDQVDVFSGTASKLTEAGAAGNVIDLNQYLDKMPNFKAYLDENPIVRLSITGSTIGDSAGAIYFSPYFDGVDDIERMPLMRIDWLKKLLDGSEDFAAAESANLKTAVYTPYMPTEGKVEVDVVKADGTGTEKVTKDYSKYGNIIKKMNDSTTTLSGVDAVNMLRDYIDATYNNYYGTTRSDLFAGQNAAWDADELVALLRCVVANAKTLNGTDTIYGLFAREAGNNQRQIDLFRFAGSLFGVRGLESRSDYYYFDKEGNLVDARDQEETYAALERMNALNKEGLIAADYKQDKATAKSENYLADDTGFMSYDYNQTQTILNDTKLNANGTDKTDTGEAYSAVMVPVAKWDDGDTTTPDYFRFTESWRSVKTDGWGISKAGINGDANKLKAALKLIDYAYSEEGQILMSYGPDAFISVKDAAKTAITEKYNCFDFNGKMMPEIAATTKTELATLAGGNYTNYARQYLGSTLSFLKSQAFEFQCTNAIGQEGAAKISAAIKHGTIKHPILNVEKNMWYTSIPTVFPTTEEENTEIETYTNLLADGKFSQSSSATTARTNIFVNIIKDGYTGEGTTSRAATIASVKSWGTTRVTEIRQIAWDDLSEFYEALNK